MKPKASRYTSKMWKAFDEYQLFADADGHGVSWAVMCQEQSIDAAQKAIDDISDDISDDRLSVAVGDAIDVIWAIENNIKDGSIKYFSDSAASIINSLINHD